MTGVTVRAVAGEGLVPLLGELARLRLTVFRDWPYLYDGAAEYEAAYLRCYATAPGAAIMVAQDGATVVGASTCLPMDQADAAVRAPFLAAGIPTAPILYFGESVLLAPYRGRGIGVRFFALREAHGRALGLTQAVFCAVQRPASHKLRPEGAAALEPFWRKRGYTPRPELMCHMSWRDIGQAEETTKPLMFWSRTL